MTERDVTSTGSSARRISWALNHGRKLLILTGRGGMTDSDLLVGIPTIWEQHPEVIGYDTLVDARRHNHAGAWTWGAMRELNRRRFSCFDDPDEALAWLGRPPACGPWTGGALRS